MSAPSTSCLSVELLLRVIVKHGCFALLYFYFLDGKSGFWRFFHAEEGDWP